MVEEMERDENVFLMGEEVAEYNGAYKVSKGMLDKFGPKRVIDTPISEAAFSGLGIGAATLGLRPIVEFMSWSFTLVCLDQLVNNAANVRYMSGGQFKVPVTFRGGNGIAHQLGATHSHRMESVYARIPGLIVVTPSTPAEAMPRSNAAIRTSRIETPRWSFRVIRSARAGDLMGDADLSRQCSKRGAGKHNGRRGSPSARSTRNVLI